MKNKEVQSEAIDSEQRVIKFNPEAKKESTNVAIEIKEDKENLTPYYKSSILGKLFFNWSRYSMSMANKNPLKIQDFRGIADEDKSQNLYITLNEKWNQKKDEFQNKKMKENAFYNCILKTYYKRIIILTILNLCCSLLEYLQIYFYDSIIENFECRENGEGENDEEETECPLFPVYVNAIGLVLSKLLTTFFHHQTKFHSEIMGVKAANAVAALIYDKVTKSSIFIKNQISEGEILNYIQVDSEKLNYLFTSLPAIIIIPINIIISFYALFKLFGISFFVGVAMIVIMVLIIWLVQYFYLKHTKIILRKKDKRMRITTHSLHIIKVLKLFGWEDEFKENIEEKRNDELINIKYLFNLIAVRNFVNSNLSLLASLASIGGYTLINGPMDISTLFTSTQLINEVSGPTINIPQYIADLKSLMISLNRIQKFLIVKDIKLKDEESKDKKEEKEISKNENKEENSEPGEDKKEEKIKKNDEETNSNDIAIEYTNCDFGIKAEDEEEKGEEIEDEQSEGIKENKILLKGVNLIIKKGELITMIGETGSGKTCLINAILNNLDLLNSNEENVKYYHYSPVISYACQDPWIMNGTIRDNIIFYSEYDKEKYNQVINACQLDKDFENLKHGDLTEIGSTGNNISGGQRARISLARAIYKEADIYLFDDPIPSVDSYVSVKIFHQAIVNLLKNKTRIFVTHDTRNLKASSRIIYMNNFKIEFNGTFDEFSNNEIYKDIINNNKDNKKVAKLNNEITDIKGEYFTNKDDSFGKLLRDEDQVAGKVSCKIYCEFFKIFGGILFFILLIILTLGISGLNVYGKLFVTDWTDKAEDEEEIKKDENYKFFIKYTLICFGSLVIQLIKEFLIAYSNYRGTKKLHEDMISNIMNAPINLFHDILPIGQILNRLIHDLEKAEQIIWKFNTILISLIGILTSIYVCFMENRETIYASPIIIILALILLFYFISAGRDLDRLDGTSRSPIISLFSETILGITTIRTFKQETPSKNKFYKRLDDHFGVMLYRHGTDNWLCMSLDLISHIYLTYVLIRAIIGMDKFSAATVGIMLDYAIEFSEELLEAFEQATQVEKSLICLERCDAFRHLPCENYENEKLSEKENDLSEKSWPGEGKVIFDKYSMKYRDDCDLALKDICIEINPGEKIGIIGRTGSGKSSLTLSLFRIIEATKGTIIIDGRNISDIPLKKLRRSLSIVPQEPFLLEGTLKTNLDPLNLYSDEEINEILKNVKLYEMLEHDNANYKNQLKGINTEIKEYGNNLSFGCRQLLCVARAILRKSKIIILDEATSSVDQRTEDIISNTVDNMFKDSTVITIAHRINTVKKCDRIVVMDEGKIVEIGKPDELIKDSNSKFYSLYYIYIGSTE